jgi:hypothetical protein
MGFGVRIRWGEVGVSDRVIYVVGARFIRFATGRLFLSLEQLRRLLVDGDDTFGGHVVVLPGQGLSDGDVAAVLALASGSPQRNRFDFTAWYHRPKRADLGHGDLKGGIEDVLISRPRRVAATAFELDLLIGGACSLMVLADPRRLILAEAARQSAVAIGRVLDPDRKCRTTRLEATAARYDRFVPALDARIRCTVDLSCLQLDIAIDQGGLPLAAFDTPLMPASGEVGLTAVA